MFFSQDYKSSLLLNCDTSDVLVVDTSFYSSFGRIIGDKRIVLLGEYTHGDGSSLLAKEKIIKYLIESKGFDVLVLEMDLYECQKAHKLGKEDRLDISNYFRSMNKKGQMSFYRKGLFEFLEKNKSVMIEGLDLSFSSINPEFMVRDIDSVLSKNISDIQENKEYQSWKHFMLNNGNKSGLEKDEIVNHVSILNSLIKDFNKIDNYEMEFVIQLFKNELGLYTWLLKRPEPSPDNMWEFWKYRDKQMADNLEWLLTKKYKNKKIIVSTSSYHLIKNYKCINMNSKRSGFNSMLSIVNPKLYEEMYSISFIRYSGSYMEVNGEARKVVASVENSLESNLHKCSYDEVYIDLSSLDKKTLSKE